MSSSSSPSPAGSIELPSSSSLLLPASSPSPSSPLSQTPSPTPHHTIIAPFLVSQLRYTMRNHSLSPHAVLLPVLQSLLPHNTTLLSHLTITLSVVHIAWLLAVCITFLLASVLPTATSSADGSNTTCSPTNALRIGAALFVFRYAVTVAFIIYDMLHRWLTHRQRKPPTYFTLLAICRTVCVLGTTVSTVIVWGLHPWLCTATLADRALYRLLCALTVYEWTLLAASLLVVALTFAYVVLAPASWQARHPVPPALLAHVLPESLRAVATSSSATAGGAGDAGAATDPLLLTTAQLAQLPAQRYDETTLERAGQTLCVICMSDFEPDDRVHTLACHHAFHTDCSTAWLAQKSTCPLCVRPVHVDAVVEAHAQRVAAAEASKAAETPAQSPTHVDSSEFDDEHVELVFVVVAAIDAPRTDLVHLSPSLVQPAA